MNPDRRERRLLAPAVTTTTALLGILERGGEVRTKVVGESEENDSPERSKNIVKADAALYSESLLSYERSSSDYAHQVLTML